VRDKVKENGGNVVSMEGEDTGEWVLVDLGDMIVHIMQPAIRAYYRLEEIWGDKEVAMGAAKRVNTKAGAKRRSGAEENRPPPDHDRAPAVRRSTRPNRSRKKPRKPRAAEVAVKTAPAKKAPARKTAAKTAVGKTVKVAQKKTTEAELKALKESKPRAPRPAKAAPVKRVIKRASSGDE
jgi:ribosome-associated protein